MMHATTVKLLTLS